MATADSVSGSASGSNSASGSDSASGSGALSGSVPTSVPVCSAWGCAAAIAALSPAGTSSFSAPSTAVLVTVAPVTASMPSSP